MIVTQHKIRLGYLEHERFHEIGQAHIHEDDCVLLQISNPPPTIPLTNYWLGCITNVQQEPVEVYDLEFTKKYMGD